MSVKTGYRQGRTEFDARAFQDYAVRHPFTFADLVSGALRIPVEAGKWILGVRLKVTKGFAGATSGKIGDLADDNGFITVEDLAQANVRADGFVIDSRGLFVETTGVAAWNAFAKGGKLYTAPNQIVLTLAGTITAGAGELEIIFDGYEKAPKDMVVNQ